MTVNNVAPVVNAGPDQTGINEGQTVSPAPSTFSDAGSADTHTATIDWGDSSTGPGTVDQANDTVSGSHAYADNGTYTVTVTVTDDDGGAGSDSFDVTVNNVAPTANAGPDQTVYEGNLVNLPGSFTDPGSADWHTFLWCLVSATNGQTITDGTARDFSFTPNDNGVYTFDFTVTDDDQASHTDTVV